MNSPGWAEARSSACTISHRPIWMDCSIIPKADFLAQPAFHIYMFTNSGILPLIPYFSTMRTRHLNTLKKIYARPTSANIQWREVEALFMALGADISEREGSRIGVRLFGERRVFHRPHPTPNNDKGAITSIRHWLTANGVKP